MRPLRALALAGAAGLAAFAPFVAARDQDRSLPPAPPLVSAWEGLVGSARPQVAVGQRVLVVLTAPSLAQRVGAAGGFASDAAERRWTTAALASQQEFLSELVTKGIRIRPEYRFTRVLNGFSAAVDPKAIALLGRAPQVRGVYPVRVAYPALVSSAPAAGAAASGVTLGGVHGTGVTIALLDTGIDPTTPYLHGHALAGFDVVGNAPDARAESDPDNPRLVELHGTQMAGILAGLDGVASDATVLPIRVAGWQRDASGSYAVYARTDQIIAGLERAVDPNSDGDAHDAARVALVPLAEPFAAFADDPLARAAAGAARLDTLVVAPAGNDGPAGVSFGSLSAPGGAPDVVTVGAADLRSQAPDVRLVVSAGLTVYLDRRAALADAFTPRGKLEAALVAPQHLLDRHGFSNVAGRAVLLPAGGSPALIAEAAASAGASAVLLYGNVPAGALGVDQSAPVPVIGVPPRVAAELKSALKAGRRPQATIAAPRLGHNGSAETVATFSSWGLAFDGRPKPDVVAPGIAVSTADPGSNPDGTSRFVSVNGSSAAAAIVAGAVALLAQSRPELDALTLHSLLVGSAVRLRGQALAAQGSGLVDAGRAAASEVAAQPAALAFGRSSGPGWEQFETLVVRNISIRPLTVYVAAGRPGRKPVAIEVSPSRLQLDPGGEAGISVRAHQTGKTTLPAAGGALVLTAVGGASVRVPWAVALGPAGVPLLTGVRLSSHAFAPSETAPAVLSLAAGRIVPTRSGDAIEPVLQLDLDLFTAAGKRLGLLARLRDLLPGRYAFGLTGRGPHGKPLAAGRYRLALVAWRTTGGRPDSRSVFFSIRR